MDSYNLDGKDFIPLCDLLKVLGLCQTGGQAKLVISEGEVTVDGAQELRKRCKIRANQVVEFDGHKIKILD
jgi:ribosome-associated protein